MRAIVPKEPRNIFQLPAMADPIENAVERIPSGSCGRPAPLAVFGVRLLQPALVLLVAIIILALGASAPPPRTEL